VTRKPGEYAARRWGLYRAAALTAMLSTLGGGALADSTLEVPIAFVGPTDGTAWRGARQGLDEAQLQGEFLGQRYRLDAAPEQAVALVAALSAGELRALAEAHPGLPVLNVAAADDALREQCIPNLFHVLPSARMANDAVAQWKRAHPEAEVHARAWHPDFEKYAASQLNKRYSEQFEAPMDDQAWAGWAAVKLLSDTVAREQSATPAILLDALHSRLAFDGQKGVDMSFREDGQLRQPLLLVAGARLVGEAPVRGVVDIEDLDSLGPSRCAPAIK
jgi:hypothetical protein